MEYTSREQWGARYGPGYAMKAGARELVVAHHAGSPDVSPTATEEFERNIVLFRLEEYQVRNLFTTRPMVERHIGYNWVVMPSGRIYEGVGWGRVGAHAPGVNASGYGICIVMNAASKPPTDQAVVAFRSIIEEGLRLGHIGRNYRVAPHSEFKNTTCPGNYIRTRLGLLRHDAAPKAASMPTLRPGSQGQHVATLQRLLSVVGPPRFGPLTTLAVQEFQRAHGLVADGVVGPNTWRLLLSQA